MPEAEWRRLHSESEREPNANWKRWGPYVSERQWGTVREGAEGEDPWLDFTYEQATWRTYRWGEDGLLGFCDRQCRLCFGLALWNGKDPILKERLFGLTGPEGNHGEDVKEAYYYLEATPSHSYSKALYKYPQAEFPYAHLREENAKRTREEDEYELTDSGIFDDNRYFDVQIEYAKALDEDILIRINIFNRGPEEAPLHVLPSWWFRNTWSWGPMLDRTEVKPNLSQVEENQLLAKHETLGDFQIYADTDQQGEQPQWIFTENETNTWRFDDPESRRPSCKDAFHFAVVDDVSGVVNPHNSGTKAAAHYKCNIAAGGSVQLRLRMSSVKELPTQAFDTSFNATFDDRIGEADRFANSLVSPGLSLDELQVMRQANAGLLWTKQFYHYAIPSALSVAQTEEPKLLPNGTSPRNADWGHLYNRNIISMPDKWEYPWYAAWDSAFHLIPFSKIDPFFAKEQAILFLREWYMHPNGQLPAYEWNFSDVNPPVHAWACWRVYQLTALDGEPDHNFLERVFQKLLLNFTWWVNRKDIRGKHVFSGGFLGLDNIGVFDRSKPLPTGGHLEQADGTAWMAFFSASMMSIAFELAENNPAYEDMASKFFEHYVSIAEAMNSLDGTGLWDEEDGFYYDHLHLNGRSIPLKIRSIVGLIPLFTVDVLFDRTIEKLPGFRRRLQWFLKNRPELSKFMTYMESDSENTPDGHRLLAIPTRDRLLRLLRYLLDENEFLSDYGIRSLSKYHEEHPFEYELNGEQLRVQYQPAESDSGLFGGNSNWRGPIWFPLNYLLIESLERYHLFYGKTLRVECPTRSGNYMDLQEVADEIRKRLSTLFLANEEGDRPSYDRTDDLLNDPNWRELVLFYEYFDAETGRGLGASHQTGWTALISPILGTLASRHQEKKKEARNTENSPCSTKQ